MIYAMTVALGFAAIENLEYMSPLRAGVLVSQILAFHTRPSGLRRHLGLWPGPGPGLSASLRVTLSPSLPYLLAGAGVHAAFDFFVFLRTWTIFLVFPLLLFIVWYANSKLRYLRDQSLCLTGNICQHCEKCNAARAKFCINCGLPLDGGGEFFQICPNCQARVPRNANFCFKCGNKLPQVESGEEQA